MLMSFGQRTAGCLQGRQDDNETFPKSSPGAGSFLTERSMSACGRPIQDCPQHDAVFVLSNRDNTLMYALQAFQAFTCAD